jgi:transcriptional regulator with XRE-family HTH domain
MRIYYLHMQIQGRESLSSLINRKLEEQGMSQADLHRKSGLSRQYINDLVLGRRGRRPGPLVLRRLVKALEISKEELENVNFFVSNIRQ